jgi:hypothetical protein
MDQLDYAESWLWVHFLVESSPIGLTLLQDQLARLRMSAETRPLGEFVDKQMPEAANQLVEHLHQLERIASAEHSSDRAR